MDWAKAADVNNSIASPAGHFITTPGHAGLAIESVDGAAIDGVKISNITMDNLRQAILAKLGSRHTPDGNAGSIRNVSISDITANLADGAPDAGQPFRAPVPSYRHNRFPCIVSGLPNHPIKNVTLSRITYRTPGGGSADIANVPLDKLATIPENPKAYPEYSMHGELPAFGWFIRHASGIKLNDSIIDCLRPDSRSAVVCDDVLNLHVSGLRVANAGTNAPVVALRNVHDAVIENATANMASASLVQTLDDCTEVKALGNQTRP